MKFGKPDWANQISYEPLLATNSHTTSTSTHEGIPSHPPNNSSSMPEHLASTAHSSNCLVSPHSPPIWCIDSGIARTISNDKSLFINLEKQATKSFVTLADASKSHIMGKCCVSLNPNCSVSSTFYIPDFPMNLLSIS